MSCSLASTNDVSNFSESQEFFSVHCTEAGVEEGETKSKPLPTAVKNKSPIKHNSVEGLMVVHQKKKQRQRFLMSKSTHFVVANTVKHALEIYNNESRTELVYLLSLANAVLSFESDNANIVMEKCFCVEVRTWKKKNIIRLQPQGFIFFEDDQARMLLWVKCIHGAIKGATSLDSELFRSPSTASLNDSNFVSNEELRADLSLGASNSSFCSSRSSPTASSTFAAAREKLTQRLVTDPASRIATVGRTMLTPKRSASLTGERPSNRWGTNFFSHEKHHQTRSPMSSSAINSSAQPSEVPLKQNFPGKKLMKVVTENSLFESTFGQNVNLESVCSKDVSEISSHDYTATSAPTLKNYASASVNPLDTNFASTKSDDDHPVSQKVFVTEPIDDLKPVKIRWLTSMLIIATIAGCSDTSVFLPFALSGSLAHFGNQHQHYAVWTFFSLAVYVASTYHMLFGIGTASVFLYIWGYASYKSDRRTQLQRNAAFRFHKSKTSADTTHAGILNWMRYPDVDRVEWLNKVFATGWPYLKKAIEDSVLGSVNPLLDAQKPAFMSSLSLIRLDLGNKTPHVASVKYISADTLTDEVTLDVEVRVLTEKKSFVADFRMVSNLGAAACLSLRELLLVGTLRITLNPLAEFWPCFRGLNLCFTERPVFDFSLTAAKINIANVPFVSEWLHTFLYDLLLEFFVWPNVLNIPLWDEHGNTVQ
ncbi:Ca2-dependent lipid-binding protein CLB1/vesicle protein vp115/Granuphilin A, contains C2 domain [Plasmopara halstedii]|uniref:Ca2-dependent lipid-binding protein CLB1/vesicle protein vp115/Granuphilin A, contains C2 domain n=1 Tax=Plasmopara halstedii TaxID=4781 RepID=A0A0P1AQD4_PLAHL|nr:Ca2-dependent lipid-binding protein CLB1/vesicle protein vp115/Granuphilin A, contains C2 domain [Plasmopara halstedii]CEG43472.1 Ca2-dependent lipid-binding protein CLB1/vesicle protein vp115/Granuphilin A, contains C2 domain [Plasmopara halstedii]|eukprot:XP_024579841.1 Ca2-dependent lipid-binding protein CLB1/vesicle protein vp115/Granuphilin A, contains C2 domain [Plasmopara halstedii]